MGQGTRRDEIDVWKGFAIIAVVLIHTIGYLYDFWLDHKLVWQTFVVVDQLARFCVPLFIFVSGLTLTWKYADQLNLKEYFSRRILRIVPLYLLWTVLSYFVLHAVPGWSGPLDLQNWWRILLYGRADYQMYFVSVIFQLYLLFPFLLWLTKRFSWVMIGLSLAIQLRLYYLFSSGTLSDQEQYVFFATWIFYFVLGIFLAGYYRNLVNLKKYVRAALAFVWLVSLAVMLKDCFSIIDLQHNLNLAGRFTKLSVIFFSTATILNLIAWANQVSHLPALGKRLLTFLGRESLLIFLSHTLVLRVIFDHWYVAHPPVVLVWASLIVLWGLIFSKINFHFLFSSFQK